MDAGATSFLAAAETKRAFWPLAGRAGAVSKKEREELLLLGEEHVRPSEARGAVAALNLVPTLLLSIDWLAAAAGATTLCCFIAPLASSYIFINISRRPLHFCLFLHARQNKRAIAREQKGLRPEGESVGRSALLSAAAGRATFYWLGVNWKGESRRRAAWENERGCQ